MYLSICQIFQVDNIKNEAILRDFLQNSWVQSFFPLHVSEMPRLPRKCDARSHAPVMQNHFRKPQNLMLQNTTLCRKSAPWPLNMSDEYVSCTAPSKRHASLQILVRCPCTIPCACHVKRHLNVQKVLRTRQLSALLTSKCASRHNGVHFFNVSTLKSGPALRCFVYFDLDMCFAPQQHALFRHLNFQECSEPAVFCTFWIRNLHRTSTASHFHLSSGHWPDGSAFAALASLLFNPPEPQIIWKTQWIATFLPFAHLHLLSSGFFFALIFFFLLLFSSLLWLFPPLLSHLSILSEIWLLNCPRLVSSLWWCMLQHAKAAKAGYN